VRVAVGDVLVGALDASPRVGDVVDDEDVFSFDRSLGHRIANLGFAGFLRRADVVFHLQTREVIESEEITETAPGEPAAARERDDDLRFELAAFYLVGDGSTAAVDVLPIGYRTRELVGEVCHDPDSERRPGVLNRRFRASS